MPGSEVLPNLVDTQLSDPRVHGLHRLEFIEELHGFLFVCKRDTSIDMSLSDRVPQMTHECTTRETRPVIPMITEDVVSQLGRERI